MGLKKKRSSTARQHFPLDMTWKRKENKMAGHIPVTLKLCSAVIGYVRWKNGCTSNELHFPSFNCLPTLSYFCLIFLRVQTHDIAVIAYQASSLLDLTSAPGWKKSTPTSTIDCRHQQLSNPLVGNDYLCPLPVSHFEFPVVQEDALISD